MESEFNIMQQIKRRFFAMRNGLIADTLRKAGSPFKIIFGLNIPQIAEIAKEFGKDKILADRLWQNKTTRESMLIAPMMMNPDAVTMEDGLMMVSESPSAEIIDSLCHKLLRHLPFSLDLAIALSESDNEMARYASMRILWHHITTSTEIVRKIAEAEISRNCGLTRQPATQIIGEIEFMES